MLKHGACFRNCISDGNLRLIMVLSWLYWSVAGSKFPSNGKGVYWKKLLDE
jgi:hypothetical protein